MAFGCLVKSCGTCGNPILLLVILFISSHWGVANANPIRTKEMYDPGEHRYVVCADLMCLPGEQWTYCTPTNPTAGTCKPCPKEQWQPNTNSRLEEVKCRLKSVCDHFVVNAESVNDTTVDSVCGCKIGSHLDGKTQCIKNPTCPKGHGRSETGGCDECVSTGGYSEMEDMFKPCTPLIKCVVCVYRASDGTRDNDCGELIGGKCVPKKAESTSNPPSINPAAISVLDKPTQLTSETTVGNEIYKYPNDTGNNDTIIVIVACFVATLVSIGIVVFVYCKCKQPDDTTGQVENDFKDPLITSEVVLQKARDEVFARQVWDQLKDELPKHLGNTRIPFFRELYGDFLENHSAHLECLETDCKEHSIPGKDRAVTFLNDWKSRIGEGATLEKVLSSISNDASSRETLV